jgi:hypothetical protein
MKLGKSYFGLAHKEIKERIKLEGHITIYRFKMDKTNKRGELATQHP